MKNLIDIVEKAYLPALLLILGRIKLFRELKCELINWTKKLLKLSLIREKRKVLKR